MKLHSIDFKNYRKSIDKCVLSINKQTIIVGKNNTAKTSVIEIMTKFLTNTSTFKISDFNYKIIKKSFINDLYDKYKNGEKELLFKFPFNLIKIGALSTFPSIITLSISSDSSKLLLVIKSYLNG